MYLESDTVLALRRMAETQGRSQAELVRDTLETLTRKSKRPKIPVIGEFNSGYTDTSERAEDLLNRDARQASDQGLLASR